MVVDDRERALRYLEHLNYYRLGAYWLPFEVDHDNHRFLAGTRFDEVLNLYVFDRELRLLVLDAIERIEVSVRARWAYHMAHAHGPHCHLDAGLCARSSRKWNHETQIRDLREAVLRSQEMFIRHLRETYEEPLPPIWAVVEIMSFGQLSKWYGNTRRRGDRNAVARLYDFDESELSSVLHHLTTVRNHCAHHARLWNREFTIKFSMPRKRPAAVVRSLNRNEPGKLFNTLSVLLYLMDSVSPGHHWRQRLKALITDHGINESHMGFPENWRDMPLWTEG